MVDTDCFFQDENKQNIILVCPHCGQKLRIPKKSNQLQITCTKCGYLFSFRYGSGFDIGELFILKEPYEFKLMIAGFVIVILGILANFILSKLPYEYFYYSTFLSGMIQLSPCLGALLIFIMLLTMVENFAALVDYFGIKRLYISNKGLALFDKENNAKTIIRWRQITDIRLKVRKYYVMWSLPVGSQPDGIELTMDENKLYLPLLKYFNDHDRERITTLIQSYLHIICFMPEKK
jgi:DNA-directed RNA polymerase subunit RPC12/RpoP